MLVADEPMFAERLKTLREAAGLNQAALAKASGVSFQTISKLERGEREPGWSIVRKLARALGVTVLAFDVSSPTSEPSADPADGPVPAVQPDAAELPEVVPEPPRVARGKFK